MVRGSTHRIVAVVSRVVLSIVGRTGHVTKRQPVMVHVYHSGKAMRRRLMLSRVHEHVVSSSVRTVHVIAARRARWLSRAESGSITAVIGSARDAIERIRWRLKHAGVLNLTKHAGGSGWRVVVTHVHERLSVYPKKKKHVSR